MSSHGRRIDRSLDIQLDQVVGYALIDLGNALIRA